MSAETKHKIVVFVNGKARQLDSVLTIGALAIELQFKPGTVLVELNGKALLRQEWPQRLLEHGDRIEFFRVVAGG